MTIGYRHILVMGGIGSVGCAMVECLIDEWNL